MENDQPIICSKCGKECNVYVKGFDPIDHKPLSFCSQECVDDFLISRKIGLFFTLILAVVIVVASFVQAQKIGSGSLAAAAFAFVPYILRIRATVIFKERGELFGLITIIFYFALAITFIYPILKIWEEFRDYYFLIPEASKVFQQTSPSKVNTIESNTQQVKELSTQTSLTDASPNNRNYQYFLECYQQALKLGDLLRGNKTNLGNDSHWCIETDNDSHCILWVGSYYEMDGYKFERYFSGDRNVRINECWSLMHTLFKDGGEYIFGKDYDEDFVMSHFYPSEEASRCRYWSLDDQTYKSIDQRQDAILNSSYCCFIIRLGWDSRWRFDWGSLNIKSRKECINKWIYIQQSQKPLQSVVEGNTANTINTSPIWNCNSCNNKNAGAVLFCRYCGSPRPGVEPQKAHTWTCPQCYTQNDITSKTCRSCGYKGE